MRDVVDGIMKIPHPEETAKRPSRRTHSVEPAMRPEPWAGRHSLGRYDATDAAIGPAALWSARATYRPSLHRHAEFVCRGHALAYAVDEARLAGRRRDRGAPPGADDLHPLHSGAASRRPAGELAALLPALGRADLGADRQA